MTQATIKRLKMSPPAIKNKSPESFESVLTSSWYPYAILAALIFALYSKALFFGLTYLDDDGLIINNSYLIGRLSNIFEAFRRDVFSSHLGEAFYRPIFTISLMIDEALGGDIFVYHLTSVIAHAAFVCLLFRVLVCTTHRPVPSFAAALIFAVHPAMSQAVAWVPGRNDSLMAILALASFLFFIRHLGSKRFGIFPHLVFFALALFTKEQALFITLMCLIYAKFIRGRRIFSIKIVTPMIWWAIIIVAWRLMRAAAFSHPIPYTIDAIAISLGQGLPHLMLYLGKLVLPFSLAVLTIPRDENLLLGAISLAIVCGLLIFSRSRRNSFVAFGTLWFVLFLWPTFIQPDPDTPTYLIGHRAYLPAVGLAFVLLEVEWIRDIDLGDFARIKEGVALLLAAALAVGTFFYMDTFKDGLNFWENAAGHSPHSPLAQRGLGAIYYYHSRLDDALALFKKSIEFNPEEKMAHGNVGLIYATKGMMAEAEAEYLKEIEQNPNYDDVHFNLGNLYYNTGRADDAEKMWKRTIEINPAYFSAYEQLADAARKRGDPATAEDWLEKSRRISAGSTQK
ncbi:MAG: tetratricopeptide repeat protein [Pseudomonadota bacterium]